MFAFGINCCCCNDLYVRGSIALSRLRLSSSRVKVRFTEDQTGTPDNFDFDFLNKRVYTRDTSNIWSLDENLKDRQTLFTDTTEFSIARGFAVHPRNGHIFYGASNRVNKPEPNEREIHVRRCDIDGTNHTTLLTFPYDFNGVGSPVIAADIFQIAVSSTGEYVFYQRRELDTLSSFSSMQLRRCDADGSNDQLIYDHPVGSGSGQFTSGLDIDNDNERVLFGTGPLRGCDFDGANQGILYAATGGSVNAPNWSHKKDRIYFWLLDSTHERGIYSTKADGSDLKAVLAGTTIWVAPAPTAVTFMTLGCGFEDVGEKTKAC